RGRDLPRLFAGPVDDRWRDRRARAGGRRGARGAGARRGAASVRHRAALPARGQSDLLDAGGDVAGGVPHRRRLFPGLAALPADGGGGVRCSGRAGLAGAGARRPRRGRHAAHGVAGDGAHPPGDRRRGGVRAGGRAGAALPVRGPAAQAQAVRPDDGAGDAARDARPAGAPLRVDRVSDLHRRHRDRRDLGGAARPFAPGGGAATRVPVRARDLGGVRRAAGGAGRRRLARAARGLADAGGLRRGDAGPPDLLPAPRGVNPMGGAAIDLLVLGVSHRTAPVAVRERLAIVPEAMAEALAELTRLPSVREAALLSTCNRVEIYAAVDQDGDRAAQGLAETLARRAGVPSLELAAHLYERRDAEAVAHLFRVASSLDSLVL